MLCHGVPLKIDPLAQLLFANTNTNKPKTPFVPLCHRLFFDRKKNLYPQDSTYTWHRPKTRIKLQLPCHRHNYFRMILILMVGFPLGCRLRGITYLVLFTPSFRQPNSKFISTQLLSVHVLTAEQTPGCYPCRSSLTSREMPLARYVRP